MSGTFDPRPLEDATQARLGALLAWLRQTTTVQGLAVMALTAVANLAGGAPLWAVLGGAAASLVLLALPGQGDLAGAIGKLATDVGRLSGGKLDPLSVELIARDGVALASDLSEPSKVVVTGTTVTPAQPPVPTTPSPLVAGPPLGT